MKHVPSLVLVALVCTGSLLAQRPNLYDLDTVRDMKLYFAQPNYWQLLLNNYRSKTEIKADLKVDGLTYKDVGVRFRGNTSYTRVPGEKKGFNIRTDAFVPGQDIYGYDHLNLNNGYHDPTFMREPLTYHIASKYMASPKCNWVRVWLNDVYWGIYINVQQPNSKMMDENYPDGDGNRYRGFGFPFDNSALTWLGPNVSSYVNNYEFKKGDGTDLVAMINVLNNTPLAQFEALVPKAMNIDGGFWYCTVMNSLVHTDCYIGTGKDHFEYHDPHHDRFHIFPFDVNESLAGETNANFNLSPWYNTTNSRRPLMTRPLQIPRLRARYIAHYRTLLDDYMSWAYMGPWITKYQALIATDVANDTKKIYPTSAFTSNITQDYRSGRSVIRAIRPLIENRATYLKGLPEFNTAQASIANITQSPQKPMNSDRIWINAKVTGAAQVGLWWRTIGMFNEVPMLDDGKNNDGAANDGVYGASIAPQASGARVEYYVSAATAAGVERFEPRKTEFAPLFTVIEHPTGTSAIRLNEALASNDTVIKDGAGEFDDCVELYNSSNAPVSASGMYLSDKIGNPTKFQIPAGQTIPAGGTLLIWCDEDQLQGPLHANFKLSASGESVFLFDTDGKTLVDRIDFGAQQTDVSIARLYDGATPWVSLLTPNPSTRNEITGGVRSFTSFDSFVHPMTAAATAPKINTTMNLTLGSGPANSAFVLLVSAAASHVPVTDKLVLLAFPPVVILTTPSSSTGGATVPLVIPNDSGLVGNRAYLQAAALQNSIFVGSNALELVFTN